MLTTSITLKDGIIQLSLPLNQDIYNKIIEENTFKNPVYINNLQNHHSVREVNEFLQTYHINKENLILSIGYLEQLLDLFKDANIAIEIKDFRVCNTAIYQELSGITLRPYQQKAVEDALKAKHGVITSPTGSGKTFIGLEIIRGKQQRSLVIVHRKELANQWERIIEDRLGFKPDRIGSGKWATDTNIVIGMVQTLAKNEQETRKIGNNFGLILSDECHHVPASTFFDVISWLPAKFRYGLSATLNRRDGLESIIYRALGPPLSTIEREEVQSLGSTVPVSVQLIQTGFSPSAIDNWNDYQTALSSDFRRNSIIIDLIKKSHGAVLVLSDRVEHAKTLSKMLSEDKIQHILAHGQLNKCDREIAMEGIRTSKVTVGTTGLLGEGLDFNHWETLVMASPISSEIKLLQAVGRIVRPANNKEKGIVFDLRDDCGFSGASFKNRFSIYKKNKIWVEFPENKKTARH